MVAEYKTHSFYKNTRKRIVSESEKTYMVVYQGSCDVSDNRFSRRIYIDVILVGNIVWTVMEDPDETGL